MPGLKGEPGQDGLGGTDGIPGMKGARGDMGPPGKEVQHYYSIIILTIIQGVPHLSIIDIGSKVR